VGAAVVSVPAEVEEQQMKAVEVQNLRKEFVRKEGRKRVHVEALRGLTFDLARGECIAILGQNGSGKSTLVRLLSTLLLPDGGGARVFGHEITETRAVRRMVNRVSVEASFFKKMSASRTWRTRRGSTA
jgi:ABC-2 type transport system ATP-binding protein